MNTPEVLKNSSARLDVDLDNIINNYLLLAGVAPHADCAAVVKANAYGLGMDQVAPDLSQYQLQHFLCCQPCRSGELKIIATGRCDLRL